MDPLPVGDDTRGLAIANVDGIGGQYRVTLAHRSSAFGLSPAAFAPFLMDHAQEESTLDRDRRF